MGVPTVDDDLVTLAQAGRRLGFTNLYDHRRKDPDFPEPAAGNRYRFADLKDWDAARGTRRPDARVAFRATTTRRGRNSR